MDINRFQQDRLRNEDDFEHKTELRKAWIATEGLTELLGPAFTDFEGSYEQMAMVLEKISKSSYTAMIEEADSHRDQTTSGLVGHIKSACNHYDPEVRQNARDLRIITDHYQGITSKSYKEQTGATTNMIKDLREKADKLNSLGITDWVNRLNDENLEFEQLMTNRQNETAVQFQADMKQVRRRIHQQTEVIYKALETFSVVFHTEEKYARCVTMVNAINKEYEQLIATRRGRAEAKKKTDE